MKEETNKFINSVSKLIELTQNGNLKWRIANPSKVALQSTAIRIEAVFRTLYKSKDLRIYKYDEKFPIVGITAAIEEGIVSYVKLEIISADEQLMWSFPSISILSSLYSAVQYQVSGVNDFIDDILEDK